MDKGLVLVFFIGAVKIQLFDSFDRKLLVSQGNLIGRRGELGSIFVHMGREGS